MLLQDGEDVLEKVQLFVARARPEIVAMHDERLFLFVAGFVDDGDAALLSEWRIGQHHLVFAVFTGERVLHHHRHVRHRRQCREARGSCSRVARRYRPARRREAVRCSEK